MSEGEQPARSVTDGPWAWESKAARRVIRDAADNFPREITASAALGVYGGLAEIASDEQSESFAAAHDWIALKSAFTRRTVQRVLPVLRDLGLVAYSEPAGLRVKTRYVMLSMRSDGASMGNGGATMRQDRISSSCRTSEESPKNQTEQSKNNLAPAPAAAVVASLPVRARDEVFEALVEVEGADLATLSKPERQRFNAARKVIREVAPNATGAIINEAARAWSRIHPSTPCTAMTIAGHWSQLTSPGRVRRQAAATEDQDGPDGWQAALTELYPHNTAVPNGNLWSSIALEHQTEVFALLRTQQAGGEATGRNPS